GSPRSPSRPTAPRASCCATSAATSSAPPGCATSTEQAGARPPPRTTRSAGVDGGGYAWPQCGERVRRPRSEEPHVDDGVRGDVGELLADAGRGSLLDEQRGAEHEHLPLRRDRGRVLDEVDAV